MGLFHLPPWPGWDGLHPLVIHFPIALLLIAPLFVLLAAAMPKRGAAFAYAALILMACGTLALFVAAESGEAAGQLADGPGVPAVLEHHEHLAEATQAIFATLTGVYAVVLAAQWWFVRLRITRVHVPIHVGMLLLLLGGGVVLANTAHQGRRLVHELGVHALMPPGPAASAEP